VIDGSLKKPLLPRIFGLALVLCVALAGTLALAGSASAASTGVLAWGANGTGQLGDGTDTGPEECFPGFPEPCSIVPVPVGGLSEVKSVAAGTDFALALLNDGTVVSWGDNSVGQLGAGNTIGSQFELSTTPVAVGGLNEVTAIAAGRGYALALLKNGTVMAWGHNESGVLGNLTTKISTVPVAISGLSEVTAIAAGRGGYALALLKNGTVMGWGDDAAGELGAGGITGPRICETCIPTPVAVSGLSEVAAIAAGERSSFAVLKDGTVMAWGGNGGGQLGDGTRTDSDVPVAVSGLGEVAAIASSEWSSFAVLRDGVVMAWGGNEKGVLGDGSETGSEVPVAVCAVGEQAPCAQDLSGVTAISAGSEHTLALLGNGTVVAWGAGYPGLLGAGYVDVSPAHGILGSEVPVAVDGLSEATAISAGERFSLAIGAPAPLPRVTGLNPKSGPAVGGALVRITGSNFTGVTGVRFGSTAASFTVDSGTEITAVAPSGTGMDYVTLPGATVTPPGTVYVTVQTSVGTSPASTGGDLFFYGPSETAISTGGNSGQSEGSGASPGPGGASSSVLGVNALGDPVGERVALKALTGAQKLVNALKQCEKDRSKTKRAACEKQARSKYATAARKASRKRRRGATVGQRIRADR
jgi:alpha-tubulin suppressor-like RCC1 family protein